MGVDYRLRNLENHNKYQDKRIDELYEHISDLRSDISEIRARLNMIEKLTGVNMLLLVSNLVMMLVYILH